MAELKPCPFCGSIPFMCVNKYRHDQFTYSVKCSNSACDVIPLTYECSEETQAISDWNKRADADDVKHGKWCLLKNCANEGVYCSVCNKKVSISTLRRAKTERYQQFRLTKTAQQLNTRLNNYSVLGF